MSAALFLTLARLKNDRLISSWGLERCEKTAYEQAEMTIDCRPRPLLFDFSARQTNARKHGKCRMQQIVPIDAPLFASSLIPSALHSIAWHRRPA